MTFQNFLLIFFGVFICANLIRIARLLRDIRRSLWIASLQDKGD